MSWLGGTGQGTWNWATNPGGKYRDITDVNARDYYTGEGSRSLWSQAGQAAGGGNRIFEDFWNQNFQKYFSQYEGANEQNPDLLFPDWLTGNVASDINSQFQLQAPQARGIDRRLYDAGRFDTSY